LIDDDEAAELGDICQYFERNDGARLQTSLKQYAETQDGQSYLAEFWKKSYLSHKESVVLDLNPIFVFEEDQSSARNDQVSRAVSLTCAAVGFASNLRNGMSLHAEEGQELV
jgi:carnitine O-acetyltransferase